MSIFIPYEKIYSFLLFLLFESADTAKRDLDVTAG